MRVLSVLFLFIAFAGCLLLFKAGLDGELPDPVEALARAERQAQVLANR